MSHCTIHRHCICILILFLLSLRGIALAQSSPPEQQKARAYTLSELIALALEKSPDILVANRALDAADRAELSARLQRLPKIGVGGNYLQTADFGQWFLAPNRVDIRDDQIFNRRMLVFGATATLPLFTSGRISSEVSATAAVANSASQRLEMTELDLVYNVSQTYYNILKLQKVVEANEKAAESLQESHRIVEEAVKVGKTAPVDLMRVAARLSNVRHELIQAQNMLEISHSMLRTILGVHDIKQRIEVTGVIVYKPQSYKLDASIEQALQQRAEIKIAQNHVKMQSALSNMALAQILPNLYAVGNYVGGYANRVTGLKDNWWFSVQLEIPLLNTSAWAKASSHKAMQHQAEEELEKTSLQVILDVQTAYLNITSAEARVKAAQLALDQSRESFRIEQLKLQTGKGIVNDVLDAQADALRNEVNYYQALADYNIAQVQMRRAVGQMPEPK